MSDRDLLDLSAVCRELGGICGRTVYRLVHRGLLAPPRKIGRRSFWLRRDVEAAKDKKKGLGRGPNSAA